VVIFHLLISLSKYLVSFSPEISILMQLLDKSLWFLLDKNLVKHLLVDGVALSVVVLDSPGNVEDDLLVMIFA
jgi:hypothetical protein